MTRLSDIIPQIILEVVESLKYPSKDEILFYSTYIRKDVFHSSSQNISSLFTPYLRDLIRGNPQRLVEFLCIRSGYKFRYAIPRETFGNYNTLRPIVRLIKCTECKSTIVCLDSSHCRHPTTGWCKNNEFDDISIDLIQKRSKFFVIRDSELLGILENYKRVRLPGVNSSRMKKCEYHEILRLAKKKGLILGKLTIEAQPYLSKEGIECKKVLGLRTL